MAIAGVSDSDKLLFIQGLDEPQSAVLADAGLSDPPLFEIHGSHIFRSPWHPEGPSELPLYEIRGDQVFVSPWNTDEP